VRDGDEALPTPFKAAMPMVQSRAQRCRLSTATERPTEMSKLSGAWKAFTLRRTEPNGAAGSPHLFGVMPFNKALAASCSVEVVAFRAASTHTECIHSSTPEFVLFRPRS
jgi:hypothetical protein